MEQKLLVGYARVDITPEQYTHLGGNGLDSKRLCEKVSERIYGTCVAMTDATGETILYCPVDILHTKACLADPAREAMSEATGVPVDRIMFAASHNHSGPSISSPGLDTVKIWFAYFIRQMVKCAKEAMADRVEAQMQIGQRNVEKMNFVRHYFMNDGTVAGPNSGSFASGAKAHLCDRDEQLQVIRFVRKDARDVVLVNWQCHATISGGTEHMALCGDYIFHMRNHLEGLTGALFGFFQGAAGNLVPGSRIKGESILFETKEGEMWSIGRDANRYGRAMAEHVVACLAENMQDLPAGPIRSTSCVFEGQVDHSDDHLVEKAIQAMEEYHKYPYEQRGEAIKQVLRPAGFNSHLHANGVINRSRMEATKSMKLWALAVGDVGFITAPYEMFCSNGMYIKEHSPFKMTFIVTCSNDYNAYMADDQAYNYDIYEINTRHYGRGTAEKLAQIYVDMLQELKADN